MGGDDLPGPDGGVPGQVDAASPEPAPGLSMRLIEPVTPITVPMSQTGLNMPWEQSQSSLTNLSGCPNSYSTWGNATINQDIADATELTNRIRRAFGFSCATEIPTLSIAAWKHSKYNNLATGGCLGATPHDEISGCPEFTATTAGARMVNAGQSNPYAEVMTGPDLYPSFSAQQAIDAWMITAYHQLPFIECGGDRIGYGPDHHPTGNWRAPTVHSTTLDFARGPSPCASNGVSEWPLAGTWGVNRSWNGFESPAPPVSYPSGPVFTVRHPGASMILGVNLLDLSTTPATSVAGNFFTGHSPDPHHDPNNLLLPYEAMFIPTAPLKAQTFYEIHFPASNGQDVWWQIKTGN